MFIDKNKMFLTITVAAMLLNVIMPVAMAEEDGEYDGNKYIATATNAKWKTECGACHVAFPPHLLAAESWLELMSGLGKHFGSDASLDSASVREITGFLVENAGKEKYAASGKAVLRITETTQFKREHREVSQRIWNSPKVKSPANCSACHSGAEVGNFSEDDVRIPK